MLSGLPVLITYPMMHLHHSVCVWPLTDSFFKWITGPRLSAPILSSVTIEKWQHWAWVISQKCSRIWIWASLFCKWPEPSPKHLSMKSQDSPFLHCPTGDLGEIRGRGEHSGLGCGDREERHPPWSRPEDLSYWWMQRQEWSRSSLAGCTGLREGPQRGWDTLRLPRKVLGSFLGVWTAWALSKHPFTQCLRRDGVEC